MKTKENTEIPMVPKAHLKTVEHQRDQYKSERDSLIDDIAVLKANISRLERENELLMKERDYYNGRYKTVHANEVEARKDKNEFMKQKCLLEKENKDLRLQSNTYFDEWQTVKNLYTTLTDHIRLKAETNPGVSRYIDLVNYIDRLERD